MKRYITAILISSASLIFLGLGSLAVYEVNKPVNVYTAPIVATVKPATPTIDSLLALVNAERAKFGVAPLIIDERLNQSAQRKADDEVKYGYSGHISPNDGKHGYEYINDVGIHCKTDSENLYWGNSDMYKNTSDGAVNWWISSKPHHEEMINSNYSLTGFGIKGFQIVEHFCQQ